MFTPVQVFTDTKLWVPDPVPASNLKNNRILGLLGMILTDVASNLLLDNFI